MAGGITLLTTLLVAASPPYAAYRDGPPPGFSGGFGEPSCDACHFSEPLNDPAGYLEIAVPGESYVGGRSYPISISLGRPKLAAGGFQLTARFAEGGGQAGVLSVEPNSAERVALVVDREIEYAFQGAGGSVPTGPDRIAWTVLWTAPVSGGTVHFHVAANAGNGDENASGDFIYTGVAVAEVTPMSR